MPSMDFMIMSMEKCLWEVTLHGMAGPLSGMLGNHKSNMLVVLLHSFSAARKNYAPLMPG